MIPVNAQAIQLQVRGQQTPYNKGDYALLRLRRMIGLGNLAQNEFCFICSKIGKYVSRQLEYPSKKNYYDAKINRKFQDLTTLAHIHLNTLGDSEQNFYEIVIESWFMLTQEVKFPANYLLRLMKVAMGDHAAFRATDHGVVTLVSITRFCHNLDAYVDAALPFIPSHLYSLFLGVILGSDHPTVKRLFASRGFDGDQITQNDIKEVIRNHMIASVAKLLGEGLSSSDQERVHSALTKMAANRGSLNDPQFSIIRDRIADTQASRVGVPKRYAFAQFQQMSGLNMDYFHPVITDVKEVHRLEEALKQLELEMAEAGPVIKAACDQRRKILEHELQQLLIQKGPLLQEALHLEQQLKTYPSDLEQQKDSALAEWTRVALAARGGSEGVSSMGRRVELLFRPFYMQVTQQKRLEQLEPTRRHYAQLQRDLTEVDQPYLRFVQWTEGELRKVREEMAEVARKIYTLTDQQLNKIKLKALN